jgi:hypothetical protein
VASCLKRFWKITIKDISRWRKVNHRVLQFFLKKNIKKELAFIVSAKAQTLKAVLTTAKNTVDKEDKISSDPLAFVQELIDENLRDWFKKEKWVNISTSGKITGPCGTSKNKKNPDRCLPKAKAQSLSKSERAATARKKKAAGAKGQQVVPNTKKAKVKKENVAPNHDGKAAPYGSGYKVTKEELIRIVNEVLSEKKYKKKDDRCIRRAKQEYDTWPSALASGAVVRCRRGEIWKK